MPGFTYILINYFTKVDGCITFSAIHPREVYDGHDLQII